MGQKHVCITFNLYTVHWSCRHCNNGINNSCGALIKMRLINPLTSLNCIEQFAVMLDNFPDHGVSANTRRANKDQDLPGEGGHLLHRLVQLQVRRVHLGILADMIWESLLLFLLKIGININCLHFTVTATHF